LIDIGVNLTNKRFDKDIVDVIERAKAVHIEAMLVTGTCIAESEAALALCQSYPNFLYSTAGIHPHDADNAASDFVEQLQRLASQKSVKAIGECGLDFNRNFSTPENQKRVFTAQVELAAQLKMPLFLHQRDAFEHWYSILHPYIDTVPGMVSHCFTANEQELKKCLDAGMYIGITGWVCDKKRGQALRDIIKYIPLDRLMIETDAPYLTPQNIRPKPKSSRNEPSYLPYVVEKIAEVSSYSADDVVAASTKNAKYIFKLDE
jgi:TatD DNase family protein